METHSMLGSWLCFGATNVSVQKCLEIETLEIADGLDVGGGVIPQMEKPWREKIWRREVRIRC